MLENILAEFFGIAVTVLLVDRLLQRRESRRWQFPKQLVKAQIMDMCSKLLEIALPEDLQMPYYKGHVYYFGEARATGIALAKWPLLGDDIVSALYTKPNEWFTQVNKHLPDQLKNANNILTQFAHLVEPELLPFILNVIDGLHSCLLEPSMSDDIADEEIRSQYKVLTYLSLNEQTLELFSRLKGEADKQTSWDEELAEFDKSIARLN